tara:strand:- start:9442 stop:10470 length:1029 start_codon:yes stop_codon:yes gene_type:complete
MSLKIFFMKIFKKIFKIFFKKDLFRIPIGEKSVFYLNKKKENIKLADTILLNIPTSDNFRQAVHPDVIYIKEGFGKNKHKFWMTCTPYPNQDDRYENPEVFSSEDGLSWVSPKENMNPIFKKPKDFSSHNSDTAIIYDNKKLIVFFRSSFYKNGKFKNLLQSIESEDGEDWKNLKVLMQSDKNHFLSPSIKKIKNEWIMWTVDCEGRDENTLSVYRRASNDLIKWTKNTKVQCINLPKMIFPWHLGLEIIDNKIVCIITSCEKFGGKKSSNWIAVSDDLGFSFNIIKPFEKKYDFENWFQYRASIVNTFDKKKIEVYYTAVDKKNICYIAKKELKLTDFNIL